MTVPLLIHQPCKKAISRAKATPLSSTHGVFFQQGVRKVKEIPVTTWSKFFLFWTYIPHRTLLKGEHVTDYMPILTFILPHRNSWIIFFMTFNKILHCTDTMVWIWEYLWPQIMPCCTSCFHFILNYKCALMKLLRVGWQFCKSPFVENVCFLSCFPESHSLIVWWLLPGSER